MYSALNQFFDFQSEQKIVLALFVIQLTVLLDYENSYSILTVFIVLKKCH